MKLGGILFFIFLVFRFSLFPFDQRKKKKLQVFIQPRKNSLLFDTFIFLSNKKTEKSKQISFEQFKNKQ